MRFTPRQQQLIEYLKSEGKGKRGRWIRSFPPKTNTRTVHSLLRQGIIEQRFVPMPRHKWPKRIPKLTVSYNYQELRFKR